MKVDLGNYKYCETDELEELGKITNKFAEFEGSAVKVNGTLFITELGTYIFKGVIYYTETSRHYSSNSWIMVNQSMGKWLLSLCDHINSENKWSILNYEKV